MLDRNHHYSVKKDINFIAERTSNTSIRFVNLFKRHDNPWMNRKVRSMNLSSSSPLGMALSTLALFTLHLL